MKLIIDISKEDFEKVKHSRQCLFIDIYYLMINIITKGTLVDEENIKK